MSFQPEKYFTYWTCFWRKSTWSWTFHKKSIWWSIFDLQEHFYGPRVLDRVLNIPRALLLM